MTSPGETRSSTCFVAMPITTSPQQAETYADPDHWTHVSAALFRPAIERAGFRPIFPFAQGSDIIHSNIVSRLASEDLVLCDLSSANPNVFFEFGIRTALNLPVALVAEHGATLPFDTGIVNTFHYDPALLAWEIGAQVDALAQHLRDAVTSCAGRNPLWEKFGLTIQAHTVAPGTGSPDDVRFSLVFDQLASIQETLWKQGSSSERAIGALSPLELSRYVNEREGTPADRLRYAIELLEPHGVLGLDMEDDTWVRVYLSRPIEAVQKRITDLAAQVGATVAFTYGKPSRFRGPESRG